MNDFDQTEEYKDIEGSDQAGYTFSEPLKPLVERLLFMPNGGAICQIGPTRASFMEGNAEIGKTFLARLYEQGNSVGRAFLLAQRACMLRLPQYRDLFRSYVLLGDPRLGPTTITGVMPSQSALRGRLMPAVPNPFNPRTILRYYIATRGPVFVTIFDVQGRVVRRLLRLSSRPAGWGAVEWNGRDDAGRTVATGVYFARLLAGGVRETQRLVLLK